MSTAKPSRPRLRRILRTIHLWIGVSLGIPFALLGATGSILVYEHEIAELFDSSPKPVLAQGEARPLSAIVEAARAKAPDGAVPTMFSLGDSTKDPVMVRFARPGSGPGPGGASVRIDPVSLATFDAAERSEVQQWLRQVFMLHANALSGREGRYWVGWLGVLMCFLGLSGLIMWWPRPSHWKQAFGVIRGSHPIQFNRDLHGSVGFWGLIVFMMVCFSGVYICFPQTTGEMVRAVFPGRDLRAEAAAIKVEPRSGVERLDIDGALALARAEKPGLLLRMMSFPTRPDQAYRIAFELPGTTPGHGVPMVAVFVDPWARSVITSQDPRQFTIGESITIWQRALHGGYGLGWIWQFLTFVSGLLPVLFAITGITMWWLRRKHKKKAQAGAMGRAPSPSAAE